jgi:hypothetical protein
VQVVQALPLAAEVALGIYTVCVLYARTRYPIGTLLRIVVEAIDAPHTLGFYRLRKLG